MLGCFLCRWNKLANSTDISKDQVLLLVRWPFEILLMLGSLPSHYQGFRRGRMVLRGTETARAVVLNPFLLVCSL